MLENNIFGLRPYQQEAVCQIEDKWANGERAVLYQLPTAGGKSRIIRTIVDNHCSAKDVIYVIAHRSTLVGQLSKELDEADIKHGIIQAGFPYVRYRTQVCSMQTLIRRLDKLPEASIIIVDESHHIANNSYTKIMEKWPNANILGVTATPSRPDGRGLDKIFTSLILGPTMKELIANGFLSDYEYFAPEKSASMDGVHLDKGEYAQAEALEVVDKKFITGDAIEHYKKYADHQPAICSCISIEHSEHVAASFRAAGYKATSVNSHMKKIEVSAAIEGLRNGSIEVLTQCEMLGEGVDVPCATVLIGLRPTNSLVVYLQHTGRVLRKSKGKDKAIILDHVGNWERFGLPDDDREWTLAGKKRKNNEKSEIKRCPNCLRVLPITTRVCPYCQYQFVEVAEKGTRTIEEKAGQLVSIRGADPENIQALVRGISRETHNMKQAIKFASNMGFDHRAAWVAVTKYLKMSVDSVW